MHILHCIVASGQCQAQLLAARKLLRHLRLLNLASYLSLGQMQTIWHDAALSSDVACATLLEE